MTSLDLSSGPFLRLPSEARGRGSWRITEVPGGAGWSGEGVTGAKRGWEHRSL